MTLVKTSLLNGIAVAIKMLTLLGINKILAVYVGPSGYAALGQFQNAVQMITTFSNGAINTGVIKFTAEYHEDENRQRAVWRTAGTITIIGSAITGVFVALFSRSLAVLFLQDPLFSGVFYWFSATLVFYAFNILLLAILNGKREIGLYVLANIGGSVFSLIVSSYMAVRLGLYGALVALTIYQSIAFFITLVLCHRASWFSLRYLFGSIDKKVAIDLSQYTLMALTSAICAPISQMLVRNHLGESLGWADAGLWEAISRLSSAYLLLVTTTLSVYYLPKISELKEPESIKQEIILGYKILLPIVAIIGLSIYILRDVVIELLFSQDFVPMRDLFAWQMLGDALKISSWILAYLMLGKAMIKVFVLTEVIFSFSFVVLSYGLIAWFGLKGVVMAHAVNYLIYWIFVFFKTVHLMRAQQ